MDPQMVQDAAFLRELMDAFPAMSFVVDEDVTVVAFNNTASEFLRVSADSLRHLTGRVLSCVHAIGGTCGRTRKCKDCDVRRAINSAFEGLPVERTETTMRLAIDGTPRDFHLLVTTKPYTRGKYTNVLLFIENITEHVTLQQLLPALESCPQVKENPYYAGLLANYRGLQAGREKVLREAKEAEAKAASDAQAASDGDESS